MKLNEIIKRMHDRKLYYSMDESLLNEQLKRLDLLYDFNMTRPTELEKRSEMLKIMFAEIGENCYVEPPLRANWGGKHVHFGNNVYTNFNVTLVDDTHIYIGDFVMIGPNVTIATAAHPVHPELRKKAAQYNLPVYIENNVWIGSNAVILPGVRVGENSIIGAGSVVSKDIPPNVIAVGSPCRVLREINESDYKYFDRNQLIDID